MTEQIVALTASAPIRVQLAEDAELSQLAALGIASLADGNPQRLTAEKRELSQALQQYLQGHSRLSDVWLASWYLESPLEALEIQPFVRFLRGSSYLFSMLGAVPGIEDTDRFPVGEHWPLSCLDRERAFCLLLERIRRLWQEGYPDQEMRLALLADYASRLRKLDNHSFVCWDGHSLYAYSDGTEETGLGYRMLQGSEFVLPGRLSLKVTADEPVELMVVGSLAAGGDLEPIPDGRLCCFNAGQMQDYCDPVQLWN